MVTALQRISGRKIKGSIPALSTGYFDITPFTDFVSTEYQILLFNTSESASTSLNIKGNKTDTEVRFQKYVTFAYNLTSVVKLIKDGSDTKLQIDNTNTFGIGVSIVKTSN